MRDMRNYCRYIPGTKSPPVVTRFEENWTLRFGVEKARLRGWMGHDD